MNVVPELRRLLAEGAPSPWHLDASRRCRIVGAAGNGVGWGDVERDAALIVSLRNHADALLDVVETSRRVVACWDGDDFAPSDRVAALRAALARLDPKETP